MALVDAHPRDVRREFDASPSSTHEISPGNYSEGLSPKSLQKGEPEMGITDLAAHEQQLIPLRIVLQGICDDHALAEAMRRVLKQIATDLGKVHARNRQHSHVQVDYIVASYDATVFLLLSPVSGGSLLTTVDDDVRSLGLLLAEMLHVARNSSIFSTCQAAIQDGWSGDVQARIHDQLVAERHALPVVHMMACSVMTPLGYSLMPGAKSLEGLTQRIPAGELVSDHHKSVAAARIGNLSLPVQVLRKAASIGCREAIVFACAPEPAGLGLSARSSLDDKAGASAIHFAAEGGQCGAISLLVSLGADVNMPTTLSQVRPVAFAAIAGHREAVRLLVELGADLNARCGQHSKTLHVAAAHGTAGSLAILIGCHGCEVDQLDFASCTPLYHACQNGTGSLSVLRFLVQAGADVCKPCGEGFPPLYVAARCRAVDAVQFLLQNGADGPSTLLMAARRKKRDTVAFLLRQGCSGTRAMFLAAEKGHGDAIKILADLNVDVRRTMVATGEVIMTALMVAAQHNKADCVKTLLELGADVNAKSVGGYSAFRAALDHRSLDVILLLARAGADDMHTPDEEGETPIFHAWQKGDEELVAVLAAACLEPPAVV